jgi:hypothetical protein
MGFHKGRTIIDAGTFNARQVFQWRPSILSPYRNHDYARWNSSAILDLDADVRFAVGDESRALGDEDLCAELLCLVGPNLTKYSHFVLLSQQDKN